MERLRALAGSLGGSAELGIGGAVYNLGKLR
jgi:hypothetical protein